MKKLIVKFPGETLDVDTGKYKQLEGSVEHFTECGNWAVVLSTSTNKFYKVSISDLNFVKRV
jgi:hypothetical protein